MTEIKITRRIALDKPYEYYELEATFDPAEKKGNKVIKDTEKMVAIIRKLTATEEPKAPKKAAKISPKKDKVPEGYKEVGKTEDIKIADLKAGDKVNIKVRFLKAGDIKRFTRPADGTEGKYCKVDLEDDSGKIKMTLFDEQIELIEGVKANAWLFIQNAYCKDYKGTLELSVSYAKIESVYNG